MVIIPNTLVIALQVVPFLITILGLYVIIFKPMLSHLDGREDAIQGAQGRARELQEKLTARADEYDAKLTAARVEMNEFRAQRRAEALAESDTKVQAARGEAEALVEGALETIRAGAGAAREGLKGSSALLAQQISSQVLGRPVAS
jgi:F-type H+-transporting ATPase subunit b